MSRYTRPSKSQPIHYSRTLPLAHRFKTNYQSSPQWYPTLRGIPEDNVLYPPRSQLNSSQLQDVEADSQQPQRPTGRRIGQANIMFTFLLSFIIMWTLPNL